MHTHIWKFIKKNHRNEKTQIFFAYPYLKSCNYKKEPYKYIYTHNYELKCLIKHINIAYISELLKLLIFSKKKNIYIYIYVFLFIDCTI